MKFPDLPEEQEIEGGVFFDVVDVTLPSLDAETLSAWLSEVAGSFGKSISSLGYILCSDEYLIEMNRERLDHDTFTDIITFDLSDALGRPIEGECYISLDRVRDNAKGFGVSLHTELYRVFVHGLLHLCGLGDKTSDEQRKMRIAEDAALSRFDG